MHNDCISEQYVHEQLFHLFRKIPKGHFDDNKYVHEFASGSTWDDTISNVIDILGLQYNPNIQNVSPYTHHTHTPKYASGTITLKDHVINKLVNDVYKITYIRFYPELMMRMTPALGHTAIDIPKLLRAVIKFRMHAKSKMWSLRSQYINTQLYDDYDTAQLNAKVFSNFIYGKCNRNKYLHADFSIPEYINTECVGVWKRIDNYLGDDLLYFDTDCAYVLADKHTEAEIFKAFDSALIEYEWEIKACIGFHRKKMIYDFPTPIPYFKINNTKIVPL